MRGSSLATRLFISATAWVVVILVVTGFALSSVYRTPSSAPSTAVSTSICAR